MIFSEHFSIANIPYGIASSANHSRGVATRLGDLVIFLADLGLEASDQIKLALSQVVTRPFIGDNRVLTTK